MGSNNSAISLSIDRPSSTVYYGGDVVLGEIKFAISKNLDEIDDIYLKLSGDVGYTTKRTRRIQNGQLERITNRHDLNIFKEKLSLSRIIRNRNQKTNGILKDQVTFDSDQYTYRFAIHLPETFPPSLPSIDYPFVRYELQLCIEKKWYCPNTIYRYPLRIYPRVLLSQLGARYGIKFSTKKNDVRVKGVLQRSGLLPGEQTMLFIEIDNPMLATIKYIDACIIQYYEIEESLHRSEIVRLSVPGINNVNKQYMTTSCAITIPKDISPSYDSKQADNRSSLHVNVRYDFKLEVKIKGLFSDFDLQVPLLIGTSSSIVLNSNEKVKQSLDVNLIDLFE